MRVALLPMLAGMAMLSAPAFAGSDSADVPNPFTGQASPSTGLNSAGRAAGTADPLPAGSPQPVQPGGFVEPAHDPSASADSGGFYQASKKDAEGN